MNKEIITPAFVFNIDNLQKRMTNLNSIANKYNIKLCYAIKVNPFLISYLNDYVDTFEVCSPDEYDICKKMNIEPKKIVLSGVNKDYEDIKRIIESNLDKPIYTIESLEHLRILNELATKYKLVLDVVIRLTSGNHFGVSSDTLRKMIETRSDYSLNFIGIQYYSGTQKKNLKVLEKELDMLKDLIDSLKRDYNYETKLLEFGPGLAVSYFVNDGIANDYSQFEELAMRFNNIQFDCEITWELGRYIAYECGQYHTTIVDIKNNNDVNYVIVDGGINHLNYYGQAMAMKIPYFTHIKQKNNQE